MESNSNIDINNNLKLNNATYNIYNNDNFILIELFKYMTKEFLQENDKDLYISKYIIINKKIYVRIIQIKYISNILEKFINKLKIISDILYCKIPYSYDENAKLPNKVEIPIVLQKLENKKEYLNMINFIEYYDNRHNILDIDNIKNDLSNIISNTLSSDDYINFFDGDLDNIKYTKIKCKRINNSNLNEDEIKKNILNKKNNSLYLDINDLFENSLKSFDINNNINNKKININNINTNIRKFINNI